MSSGTAAAGSTVQSTSLTGFIADEATQKTRAWTGMWVVLGGDVAIVTAAILSILIIKVGSDQTVAILTSAFTAVSSMTAAYFGIRAASNSAEKAVKASVLQPSTMQLQPSGAPAAAPQPSGAPAAAPQPAPAAPGTVPPP